jgi:alpha-amylase/alpha-mannosidase (GH57 family)
MTRRFLCLHGHFYQPPRENPWIEEIEVQDSAGDFHDWNARIAVECYAPNGAARLKSAKDRIVDIVNNYDLLSFNFGPTLLAWLERHRPDVHERVIAADQANLARTGHGNALAQGYNHSILPLDSARDRLTQIRWGIADFEKRFGRRPEGFWLPETAADQATLAALASEGIRFTVLSPWQARRVKPPQGDWQDVAGARFDPTRPYRVRAGDREIVVFFYDGHIARDLAFGEALSSGEQLVSRLEAGFDARRAHDEVLTVAFDGETLGHHRKGGDESLGAAFRLLARNGGIEVVSLAGALERVPAEWEAEIFDGSSWSCAHGIERWRSDCGCTVGGQPGWRQAWRGPLREALSALRDRLAELYEREGAALFPDPWATRDRYVEVVLDPARRESERFLAREAGRPLEDGEKVKALRLLEMERHALLMFTSCGWFFAEISGIETAQVLKYAARAIQLARDAGGDDLATTFEEALSRAPSNLPEVGDGRTVWRNMVEPSVVSLEGIGAHLAIASVVRDTPADGAVFCYGYRLEQRRSAQAGPIALTLARLRLESRLTRETLDALCAVLHFGAADFRCGLVTFPGTDRHAEIEAALVGGVERSSLARLLREVDRFFTGREYELRDLFLDERRRVAELLLAGTMERHEAHHREVFEDHRRLMEFLREIDSPVPAPLRVAADVTLTRRLLDVVGRALEGKVDLAEAEHALGATVELARKLGAHLHLAPIRRDVEALVNARMAALVHGRAPAVRAEELVGVLDLSQRLGLWLDLWEAQNRLWDWTGTGPVTLEASTLRTLARRLWFDEETLLARGGYAPEAVSPSP